MIDLYGSTDARLLAELGKKLRAIRLKKDMTQATLAKDAGVGLSVVINIEAGKGCSISSFIKVLRALNSLELLDAFFEEEPVSPVLMAQMMKKNPARKRASKTTDNNETPDTPW